MHPINQANSFHSLVIKLGFNIFTGKPDQCVLPFLKRCLPELTSKPESVGGWTIYPPGPFPTPKNGFLSINVNQHPLLNARHSGARLDIFTSEWGEDYSPGIKAIRVWFYFETKTDANTGLETLIEMFKSVSTKTDVLHKSKISSVLIYETDSDLVSAKLILQPGTNQTNNYSILFTYGEDHEQLW